jgi:uncharacterized membrane protein YdfJ with MMPL/SSD domain
MRYHRHIGMLNTLHNFARRFAWVIVATALVLVGVGLYTAPNALSHLSTDGFFPPDAESSQVRKQMQELFIKDQPEMLVIVDHGT